MVGKHSRGLGLHCYTAALHTLSNALRIQYRHGAIDKKSSVLFYKSDSDNFFQVIPEFSKATLVTHHPIDTIKSLATLVPSREHGNNTTCQRVQTN